jgi:hypothetical protein
MVALEIELSHHALLKTLNPSLGPRHVSNSSWKDLYLIHHLHAHVVSSVVQAVLKLDHFAVFFSFPNFLIG